MGNRGSEARDKDEGAEGTQRRHRFDGAMHAGRIHSERNVPRPGL